MADTHTEIQTLALGALAASYRSWNAELPTIDRQIRDFDKLPNAEKSKTAEKLQNLFFNEYMILRQYGSSLYKPGAFAKEIPKSIADALGYVACQTSPKPQSERLWRMNRLLTQHLVEEQHSKLPPGKVWDSPRSQAAIKEVQRIWGETKPKIEQFLNDPRTIEGIRESEKFRGTPEELVLRELRMIQRQLAPKRQDTLGK